MNGGYDDGYRACPCFWGSEPGSLVRSLVESGLNPEGLRILDAGCGEGKNAYYLAELGAEVLAVDVSRLAIRNAEALTAGNTRVNWKICDIQEVVLSDSFDVVLAYGLYHCLQSQDHIKTLVQKLQCLTAVGGYHVICAFNSRYQELSAHEGFSPCLLSHADYLAMYSSWTLIQHSDSDLTEVHPHNSILHTHSMTRLIAQKGLK